MNYTFYKHMIAMLMEERETQSKRKQTALVAELDKAIKAFGTLARMH